MRGPSRIRLSKAVIESILALTVVSLLAACGASTAKGSSNSSGATGCASDFSFAFVQTDVIAGHTRDLFLLENDSTSSCTIKGYPVVTVPDPAIKVTNTASSDTWSHVAIEPVTFVPEDSPTLSPNDLHYFALQGRDDTTNCKLVSPSIAMAKGIAGSPTSVITVCGGELFVSPVVSSVAAFNQ
jgi:hypothetical protein